MSFHTDTLPGPQVDEDAPDNMRKRDFNLAHLSKQTALLSTLCASMRRLWHYRIKDRVKLKFKKAISL